MRFTAVFLAAALCLSLFLVEAQAVYDPVYTKPLDSWPGATCAYSFRKLRSAYSGPAMQVRRASDNATQDIGFTANGNFDTNAYSAFVGVNPGYVAVWYDQSGNGNNMLQPAAAKQFVVCLNASPGGNLPVARAYNTTPTFNAGMYAADSASYKTTQVNAFCVVRWGLDVGFADNFNIVGYPGAASSNNLVGQRWGLFCAGYADYFSFTTNGQQHDSSSFGQVYRNRLYQYDYNSANGTIKMNQQMWFNYGSGSANITYPTAVGLYMNMDSAGTSNLHGEWAEFMLYGTGQAQRDPISANQSSYWGIQDPPPTVTTADGITWTPFYTQVWNEYETINGVKYQTECAWDSYSLWKAQNSAAPTQNLYRFELHTYDNWYGSERSELDGAYNGIWDPAKTIQMSYADYVEPGDPIHTNWNYHGQYHWGPGGPGNPAYSFAISLAMDKWGINVDGANTISWNGATYAYVSPTVVRGQWYNWFIEQNLTGKTLKIWLNGTQVLNLSGSSLWADSNGAGGYWKIGIYRGWMGETPQTEGVRYANLEVTDKAVTDITARISNPLPVPAAPGTTYTLSASVSPSGAGNVALNPAGGTYAAGLTVTLTATGNSGYAFASWTGGASGTNSPVTVTMNSNLTATAHFNSTAPTNYTLTTAVNPAGTGSVSLNPSGGTYAAGTVVTLTATANSGYAFSSWSGGVTGAANPTTVTVNSNIMATANFAALPSYTLTAAISPTGSGSVVLNPSGGTYVAGTAVTVTATANSGYAFSSWSGGTAGSNNPTTVVMSSNKSVTANFSAVAPGNYTLASSVSPTGAGTVTLNPSGGTYTAGTTVTVTAAANNGYTFTSWTGDASGTSASAQVTMSANRSVTAVFVATQAGPIPTPASLAGETNCVVDGVYQYSAVCGTSADLLNCGWDWDGDGVIDEWSGFATGGAVQMNHKWLAPGTYTVRAIASDLQGNYGQWSAALMVVVTEMQSTTVGRVYNYKDEANDSTNFVVTLAKEGTVRMNIYTLGGKFVKELKPTGNIGDNVISLKNVLPSGKRLQKGVYVYAVVVSDTKSILEKKTGKFIVK